MTFKKQVLSAFAAAILFSIPVAARENPFQSASSSGRMVKTPVVCTTTHLSTIVEAVSDGRFETRTIIPFGMCPGHFDLSPGEARKLLETPLLLYHGYEQFLKGIEFGKGTKKLQVDIKGNWMIPDLHSNAVWKITAILSGLQPVYSGEFDTRATQYVAAVKTSADSLRACLNQYRGTPVVCSGMNRDFAEWMGFRVVAEYPRDEDVSIKTMRDIIAVSHSRGVKLVLDNKQSGGKTGRTIAESIASPMVVLTNFPETDLPYSSGYPYIRTLTDNCASVVSALNQTSRGGRKNIQ